MTHGQRRRVSFDSLLFVLIAAALQLTTPAVATVSTGLDRVATVTSYSYGSSHQLSAERVSRVGKSETGGVAVDVQRRSPPRAGVAAETEADSLPMQLHHFATNKNSVYTPQMQSIADRYGLEVLAEPGLVEDWEPLELVLREGSPTDYLANNLGVRLCSKRMRTAIEAASAGADQFQWLDAQVMDESGNVHTYYVLHFPTLPDVLDPDRTIKSRGWFVVMPVIAGSRVGAHRAFSFPGGSSRMIVANDVRQAIEQAGCTGVDFAAVALV